MKVFISILTILFLGQSATLAKRAKEAAPDALPRGIMLNLDLQQIVDGLIPSKTLYPLYVPLGDLVTDLQDRKTVILFQADEGLTIPASSLLNPDGKEWTVSIRVRSESDGLIISQENQTHGFAIYMHEGSIQAKVKTADSICTLQESAYHGINSYQNKWVTIELRIKKKEAILILNRNRVAVMPLTKAFSGDQQRIRIGAHETCPLVLKESPLETTIGFTGAMSSLKLIRQ